MRDGTDSTTRMIALMKNSQFAHAVRAVLLQGIAVAGFNVVDIHRLSEELAVPVLVVVRRQPHLANVKKALLTRVSGGERKWRLVERAGEPEPMGSLWIQRANLSLLEASVLIKATTLTGNIPEPLRLAHLIAGGVTDGASRGRA